MKKSSSTHAKRLSAINHTLLTIAVLTLSVRINLFKHPSKTNNKLNIYIDNDNQNNSFSNKIDFFYYFKVD